jgi:hypothetical protein
MKRILLAVLMIAIATTAFADDDLVAAAKAAKAKRKKSTTKVITNADVKKAKSSLSANKLEPLHVESQPAESSLEKQAREKKEQLASDVKLAAAQRNVAQYEKELTALEQSYYEEDDLDRRDGEIVRRFNETRAKLEAARKELDALLPPPPPPVQELHSETAQSQ